MGDLARGFGRLHSWARGHSIGQKFKRSILGDATYDKMHPIGTAATALAYPPPTPPVIPMPDEEMLTKAKRRNSQTGRTGRAATIMSDEDTGMGL